MSKRRYKIVPGAGDFCPRCKLVTQIREHIEIRDKQLQQPFYYSRWFNCTNKDCQTTLIMPKCFMVYPSAARPVETIEGAGQDV